MRSYHVFDLDGTLLDTKAATIEAYRSAARKLGMAAPPEAIWGHTATEWRCPPELHAAKLVEYSLLVPLMVRPAWAAETYTQLLADGYDVRVVTGASKGTVEVLSRSPYRDFLRNVACGLSVYEKTAMLHGIEAVFKGITIHYYDDNAEHGRAITVGLKDAVLHVKPKGASVCA